ncbi:gliding motility-associated peptidyl-prolyl isomerase GldI [Bizionia gelidisalsuginis]|uniref:Peptidyl-prolyl cis-trans isomerase n=2 Tax=Bizionia TaxID=283785 RepID=A0A8H2LCA1_9FLAO|nr:MULTISPECIES: gliding motility-associated peptidyl-prolyl isomerase GldI [Bizionia]TYB70491.1 gliding motility-associated peptidyl-prolyl isomerase GldI [Bizionia saleffrena]TYC10639.1 gliding motility-associated peptidyl-prolyl isomerase GldI [Bizionia gelidisalsuginis]
MNKLFLPVLLLLAFSCKSPEARKPISVKTGSFINESVQRNINLYNQEKEQIQAIISEFPNEEYISSENGFWYTYINKVDNDSLETPDFGDIINFNYDVSRLDGSTIYSKENLKTRNYAMDQEELFKGLRTGLKLMKATETIKFIFPSQMAYGYYGDDNKIGRNLPIVCEVTINTIIKK